MKIADRMKKYEGCSRIHLTPKTPVIIRVDGRHFHTLTKSLDAFDWTFTASMHSAAIEVFNDIQGCVVGYVQSDEASFLLSDFENLNSEGWFDYNLSKIVSLSAARMSVSFNKNFGSTDAVFDSRAFNIPKEDIANYFLWRCQDFKRNSLQMYARMFFSHKELHKKNSEDIHNMLHNIGKNWANDLLPMHKNGVFMSKEILNSGTNCSGGFVEPNYEQINTIIQYAINNE